jgi:pyrimidine-nucleoside phosphorylase
MRAVDVIEKTRDGIALTADEITAFIHAYTVGDLPDYQVAAWLMAVVLKGLSRDEVVSLTLAMARSGTMMELSDTMAYAVDKHSSGGVGDKTTLIVLPIVAACGVPIAKMSGRGLGFSGGTLDKLDSIPGFRTRLSDDEYRKLAKEHGLVLAGQTGELAPADGKLYALRDVTGTVPSIPLIASSIMSKKLAGGANGIVLDVKVGSGAFMTQLEDARLLAQTMVDIGVDAGRDMVALLSDMNQPLGRAVGNALEVREAVEVLQGRGAFDLVEHCIEVAAHMLVLASGHAQRWSLDEARAMAAECLQDGQAWARFRAMVQAQGGDVDCVDDPSRLLQASLSEVLCADRAGRVQAVRADLIGKASLALGAGRASKDDPVDLAVGIEVDVRIGDAVSAGQELCTVYANDPVRLAEAMGLVRSAIIIGEGSVESPPLFYGVVTSG